MEDVVFLNFFPKMAFFFVQYTKMPKYKLGRFNSYNNEKEEFKFWFSLYREQEIPISYKALSIGRHFKN